MKPNSLIDYYRDIGRRLFASEGRKPNESTADCNQVNCVHEFDTGNSRHHVAKVHVSRNSPKRSITINYGRREINKTQ